MQILTTVKHHSSNRSTSAHMPSFYGKAHTGNYWIQICHLSHEVQVSPYTTAKRVTVQKDQEVRHSSDGSSPSGLSRFGQVDTPLQQG